MMKRIFNIVISIVLPLTFSGCLHSRMAEQSEKPLILSSAGDGFGDTGAPALLSYYYDIEETTVYQTHSGALIFEILLYHTVAGDQGGYRFFGWCLDTDANPDTGLTYNDIGSDFDIRVKYDAAEGTWLAVMYDMINTQRFLMIEDFTVQHDTIRVTIPLGWIGDPGEFRWVAVSKDLSAAGYTDIVPDESSLTAVYTIEKSRATP